jgi:hypothetical protein
MSDVGRRTDKPMSGMARLVLDETERGQVYYSLHDNCRQVVLTQNGILVRGDEAILYIGDTPYRLRYTGSLGNWKLLDRFVS